MNIKDALYRELRFSSALQGLVDGNNIKQDMRSSIDPERSEDGYPLVIFRRIVSSEDNQVRSVQERIEIELIGLQSSTLKGDDLLEEIRLGLINHFAGKKKTWGQYDSDGTPNSAEGIRMSVHYIDTVDGFSEAVDEKVQILLFDFTFIRP